MDPLGWLWVDQFAQKLEGPQVELLCSICILSDFFEELCIVIESEGMRWIGFYRFQVILLSLIVIFFVDFQELSIIVEVRAGGREFDSSA